MATYDFAAIASALRNIRSPQRQINNRSVKQRLISHGVPERIAWSTSMNEFCYWTDDEIEQLFRALDLPSNVALDKLLSLRVQPAHYAGGAHFVKPRLEDIQHSADTLSALCVDRQGQFCNNPQEGFAALSHVWSQGLGADDDNRGLHKSLLDQVFDKVEPLGVRWIWTDSLAIPGGKRALSLLEEELKGTLINAMADIYRQAKYVIVLDALCLRLDSDDPVDVAAVLCLGTWMTRMWTYQEIKLATNAIIATKSGFVGFSTIVNSLKSLALEEAGQTWDEDAAGKYPSLARTFFRLQRDDDLGITLPDVAIGCGYREAWDRLDYARAVFPTLGIEWRTKYDTQEAMRVLYKTQKHHATRLCLFHGPPRASLPGWAPAVFNGLVDSKVIEPGKWESRGMRRTWLTTKVKSIIPSKPDRLVLALESDFDEQALTVGFISEQTLKESPESVKAFKTAVAQGNAYLLADESLVPPRRFSRIGLLVERFTKADNMEAWVCLTLAVGETEETYKAEKQSWLLLHENPVSTELASGKGTTELRYSMEKSVKPSRTADWAHLPLHRAVQKGDVEECQAALERGANVNMADSRGCTALHVAAASNQLATIPLLINAGGNVNQFDYDGHTPLTLAIENFHVDAVLELFENGADMNASHRNGFSPLCTAVLKGDLEMVNLLLALGANPSAIDAGGWVPLHLAVPTDDGGDEVLESLLEAGADPNIASQSLLYPIDVAARNGRASAVQKLLQYGANPNSHSSGVNPPLCHAIISGSAATVKALLDGGASHTVVFEDDWTPMMLAAKQGDHDMGKYLLARGARIDTRTADGLTPLHIAASSGSRIFYKWLVEVGADTNARDRGGRRAQDMISGF